MPAVAGPGEARRFEGDPARRGRSRGTRRGAEFEGDPARRGVREGPGVALRVKGTRRGESRGPGQQRPQEAALVPAHAPRLVPDAIGGHELRVDTEARAVALVVGEAREAEQRV